MDHDAQAWDRRHTTILASVSSLVLTISLFSPASISIGNFMEFSFEVHQSLLFFLAVSLASILVISVAVWLSCRHQKTCRIVVSVLFASAFLMWLQGNIILWKYGVLDGTGIEWNALLHYGIIDTALWAAVISFSVLRADLVFRVSRFASLILIIVQLVSVSWSWISMPKDQSFKRQQTSGDTLFLFSRHANVIVLVLDTFQSDLFQDIVLEDPGLKASFDGFTYFRNSLAGSDGTSVSIPNMLTAENYDNSMPYLEFVKRSYLDNSLPKTLKEYGFSIDLYPILKYSVYSDFSGTKLPEKRLMDWGGFFREQAFIADLALFRSLPHFMKQAIYNRERWFISGLVERHQDAGIASEGSTGAGSYDLKYSAEFANSAGLIGKNWDAGFINRMIPKSGIVENTDTFKFYHLNGLHPALVMNEELEYEVMNPTRAGMKRQGTGILKIAAIILERLKQLAVYDDSLIFIVGDHGSGLSAASINASPYGSNLNRNGPYKGLFKNFKSAGIPLILVKRMKSSGELKISDAPVCLGDIPETVAEELRLDARFPGKSMFAVKENEERERIYRAFIGPQEDIEYLAPLYEYSVNGFSWDDTSWRETGNTYVAKGDTSPDGSR